MSKIHYKNLIDTYIIRKDSEPYNNRFKYKKP